MDGTRLPSRRAVAFCLDAALFVAFLLLLSPRLTGLRLHEWLGLAFCGPMLVHLLLSWAWIGVATKRLFTAAGLRQRINYGLNVLLFILIIIEIVSGVVISQVVLPFAGIETINDRSWRALHNLTLNVTELVVCLHIAMNWQWIVTTARSRWQVRAANNERSSPFVTALTRTLWRSLLVLLAAGVVAVAAFAWLGPPAPARRYVQDEIARFGPTAGHGLGQLAGMTLLLCLVTYAARRWLRVRL